MGNKLFRLAWIIPVLLASCARNRPSQQVGYHWHTDGPIGGHRFLVEDKTGHVRYWMYKNSADTCTAQDNDYALEFTRDFVDCNAAEKAIEDRENARQTHDPITDAYPLEIVGCPQGHGCHVEPDPVSVPNQIRTWHCVLEDGRMCEVLRPDLSPEVKKLLEESGEIEPDAAKRAKRRAEWLAKVREDVKRWKAEGMRRAARGGQPK